MVLFLVMVIFLAMDISFVKIGYSSELTSELGARHRLAPGPGHRAEHPVVPRPLELRRRRDARDRLRAALVGDLSSRLGALFQFKFASGYRIMLYGLMRKSFIAVDLEAKEGVDLTFDFANYCAMALGHTIAELVEVPFWNMGNSSYAVPRHLAGRPARDGLLLQARRALGIGFTMPLFLSVVHAKIRAIESGTANRVIGRRTRPPRAPPPAARHAASRRPRRSAAAPLEVDDDVDAAAAAGARRRADAAHAQAAVVQLPQVGPRTQGASRSTSTRRSTTRSSSWAAGAASCSRSCGCRCSSRRSTSRSS